MVATDVAELDVEGEEPELVGGLVGAVAFEAEDSGKEDVTDVVGVNNCVAAT